MALPRSVKGLCTPALVYFIISIMGLMLVVIQNIGNTNIFNIGSYSMRVPSTVLIFIMKLIYILFWTWILNLICKDGYSAVSWLLVLLPFILVFVMVGLVILNK